MTNFKWFWVLCDSCWTTNCPVFHFSVAFQVSKHYYISMSSSPELWATGKLYREECVSAGGLQGLWGVGDEHGVRGCWDTVCCLRCLCNEPFRFRQKGSSGGRHNTNSMQEWLLGGKKTDMRKLSPVKHVMFLISSFNIKHSNNKIRITYTDWATVCGRMSLMPRCRPSFRLSEITSTGRLGAGSTSKSSSSSSSSSVILQYVNITVFTLRIRGYSTHTVPTPTTECKTNPLWIMRAAILGNKQANILIQFIYG